MAGWLTPLRAAGIAIAAGLVLGVAVGQATAVPDHALHRPGQDPASRASRHLQWRARTTTAAHQTAMLVDSLRRGGTLRGVVMGRRVPPRLAEQITQAGATLPTHGEGHPMALVAVVDSSSSLSFGYFGIMLTYALPRSDDEPCLAIVRLGHAVLESSTRVGNLAAALGDYLPGPCGFVAAFGRPGPAIAGWLGTTNGVFATYADWSSPTRPMPDAPSYGLRDVALRSSALMSPSFACLRRDAEACGAVVMSEYWDYFAGQLPPKQRAEMTEAVGVVTARRVAARLGPYSYGPGITGQLLSDLVAREGPEAFRAFWTSSATFDEAFTAAFGASPGAWVADWYDAVNIPVPRELRSPARALPGGILLIVLGLGGALLYSSRRTVSA